MAKNKVGVLKALLTLNDSEFQARMKEASKRLGTFEKDMNKRIRSFEVFGRKMAKVGKTMTDNLTLPIGGAIVGLAFFEKKVSDVADRIDKLSGRLALSRKRTQELDFVASQTGVDLEQMAIGIAVLQKAVFLATGTKDNAQTRALRALQVEVHTTTGKMRSFDDILPEVITKLQKMEDKTKRNALAMLLFSQGVGQRMIPMLDGGAKGFAELTARANELGLVIADEDISAMVAFHDLWDRIQRQLNAVAVRLGSKLIPLLNSTLVPLLERVLLPALRQVVEWIGQLSDWFNRLPNSVKATVTVLGVVLAVLGPLVFVFGKFAMILAWMGKGLFAPVITALKGLAAGLATAGIKALLITAALGILAGLAAVVARNWEAFTGWWAGVWNRIVHSVMQAVQDIGLSIGGLLASLGGDLFGLGTDIIKWSADLKSGLDVLDTQFANLKGPKTFGDLMRIVMQNATADWETLKKAINEFFDSFGQLPPEFDTATASAAAFGEMGSTVAERWGVDATDAMLRSTDALRNAVVEQGKSLKELGTIVLEEAKKYIRAKMFEAVASYVESALATVPFPFGLIAAGAAAAGVVALFNQVIPFAEGGVVTGPTNALIGEAGPEVVFPLDRLDSFIKRVAQPAGGVGESVVRGNDIYIVNQRAQRLRARLI